MEATSAATPSPSSPLSEMQQNQVPVSTTQEQNLFDYLIEVEKGLGISGEFTDPSAFFGKALDKVGEIARQAQDAIDKANVRSGNASGEAAEGPQESNAANDLSAREQNIDRELEQLGSLMWASYNVHLASNGLAAVTSSANTLIRQQ